MTDEHTEVSAVRFSHPTPGEAVSPSDAQPAAPLLFLAPAETGPADSDGQAG